jgi:hypothetical protein
MICVRCNEAPVHWTTMGWCGDCTRAAIRIETRKGGNNADWCRAKHESRGHRPKEGQ